MLNFHMSENGFTQGMLMDLVQIMDRHDVENAEGDSDNTFAWNYLDTDYYGRLLKAYDFEAWTPSFPITTVYAAVGLNIYSAIAYDPNDPKWLNVEIRVFDGIKGIVSKTEPMLTNITEYIPLLWVEIPSPVGGWTKDKIDSLEIWVGEKERADLNMWVYYTFFLMTSE